MPLSQAWPGVPSLDVSSESVFLCQPSSFLSLTVHLSCHSLPILFMFLLLAVSSLQVFSPSWLLYTQPETVTLGEAAHLFLPLEEQTHTP